SARIVEREPARAIHFRVAALPDHERVAAARGRVAVALGPPRVHDLAALLAHRSERIEPIDAQIEAGLLAELALRRRERIGAGLDLAFRNRPRAVVAPRPERPTGVDEEHLDHPGAAAKLENPSALPTQSLTSPARLLNGASCAVAVLKEGLPGIRSMNARSFGQRLRSGAKPA